MSISVIGWANNVNKIILNETSGSNGDGAVTSQRSENGGTFSILNGWVVPPRFSVVMMFDNDPLNEDENGLTEYERFDQWFTFRSKYGTVPFSFPALTHSNPLQITYDNYARYIIPDGKYDWTAEGCYIKVVMVWEQFYYKAYKIQTPAAKMSETLNCYDNHVEIVFTSRPDTIPATSSVDLTIKNSKGVKIETKNEYMTDNGFVFCYFFNKITDSETYTVTVNFGGKTATGTFAVK